MYDYSQDKIFLSDFGIYEDIPEPDSRKSFLFELGGEKCGVYRISNDLDHKIYIGSSKELRVRWKKHVSDLLDRRHGSKHLQYFFNKHKEIHFTLEVLETCSEDILVEREQYYLDTLKPFGENGFNSREIACNSAWTPRRLRGRKIYCYDKLGNLKEFKCASEAAKELFLDSKRNNLIFKVATGREKSYRGYIFSYFPLEKEELDAKFIDKRKLRHKRSNGRRMVEQLSENGEVRIFKKASEAAIELGFVTVCINKACRDSSPYKGFYWRYLSTEKKPPKELLKRRMRPLGAFNESGEMVLSFNSGSEAKVAGFDRNLIIISCKKRIKHKGYYWKYLDGENKEDSDG